MLLPHSLSSVDETDWEYSPARTDDLIRFWRSEVKVTAGRWSGERIRNLLVDDLIDWLMMAGILLIDWWWLVFQESEQERLQRESELEREREREVLRRRRLEEDRDREREHRERERQKEREREREQERERERDRERERERRDKERTLAERERSKRSGTRERTSPTDRWLSSTIHLNCSVIITITSVYPHMPTYVHTLCDTPWMVHL